MKTFMEHLAAAAQPVLTHEPPPLVVLKRLAIRQYPNGFKVALYAAEALPHTMGTVTYTDRTH
jgi:hypothetical protein